jgi:hypothetical protein
VEAEKIKWWMRRRTIICGIIAAALLTAAIFVLIRWYSNVTLAKELRAEIETWLQTLPQIPDSENGMLPVLSGLESFKGGLPQRLWAEDFGVENESDKTLLKQYLAEKEQALGQIYKGLTYKKFLFPGDYRKGYARGCPNMLAFRIAARLLELKGGLLESEGKKSEALNEYLNIFRLGETLSGERSDIPCTIEAAVLDTAFRRLTRFLSDSSVGEKDISSALKSLVELHGDCSNVFTMSKEADYYSFLMVVADVIEGKLGPADGVLKYFYNFRYDVDIYRRTAEIWRNTDPAKYYALPPEAKSNETFLEAIGMHNTHKGYIARVLPNHLGTTQTLALIETLWRGAIALAAVRLFEAQDGRLPKNLQKLGELVPKEFLIDPFSGKEIIYRLVGNDFYLYSVGLDGMDGNPVNALPYFREKKYLSDLQDIIFHAPSAPLKEK